MKFLILSVLAAISSAATAQTTDPVDHNRPPALAAHDAVRPSETFSSPPTPTPAAGAPPAPPSFVPFEIDEHAAQLLMGTLGDVPYKYANPIVNFLQNQEQRAQVEWYAKPRATASSPKSSAP